MSAHLTYFNGRGRAEVIRYLLGAAGISFTETFLEEKDDMTKLRASGKLLFGQVPLLEIDGKALTQTEAIIRYIARNYNLYGSSEDEQIQCDMMFDGVKDADLGLSGIRMEFKSDEDKVTNREHMKERIAKYFPKFVGLLGSRKFLVGDNLTFVDVVFLHDLDWVVDCLGNDPFNEYPVINEYRNNLRNIPNIAKYLTSDQKKPYPDATYLATVKRVLYS